jgi:predicted transcriptional regulator
MIMDKTSNSEDDNGARHNVEGFVLDRLSSKHDSGGDPLVSIGDLMESIDTTMSPLLDQAIEDLVAQSMIQSPDGENYQITQDGINELENRKREAIPL